MGDPKTALEGMDIAVPREPLHGDHFRFSKNTLFVGVNIYDNGATWERYESHPLHQHPWAFSRQKIVPNERVLFDVEFGDDETPHAHGDPPEELEKRLAYLTFVTVNPEGITREHNMGKEQFGTCVPATVLPFFDDGVAGQNEKLVIALFNNQRYAVGFSLETKRMYVYEESRVEIADNTYFQSGMKPLKNAREKDLECAVNDDAPVSGLWLAIRTTGSNVTITLVNPAKEMSPLHKPSTSRGMRSGSTPSTSSGSLPSLNIPPMEESTETATAGTSFQLRIRKTKAAASPGVLNKQFKFRSSPRKGEPRLPEYAKDIRKGDGTSKLDESDDDPESDEPPHEPDDSE